MEISLIMEPQMKGRKFVWDNGSIRPAGQRVFHAVGIVRPRPKFNSMDVNDFTMEKGYCEERIVKLTLGLRCNFPVLMDSDGKEVRGEELVFGVVYNNEQRITYSKEIGIHRTLPGFARAIGTNLDDLTKSKRRRDCVLTFVPLESIFPEELFEGDRNLGPADFMPLPSEYQAEIISEIIKARGSKSPNYR